MPTQTKDKLEELSQGWLASIHRDAESVNSRNLGIAPVAYPYRTGAEGRSASITRNPPENSKGPAKIEAAFTRDVPVESARPLQ